MPNPEPTTHRLPTQSPPPPDPGPGPGPRGRWRRLGALQLVALLIGVVAVAGGIVAVVVTRSAEPVHQVPQHGNTTLPAGPHATPDPASRRDTEAAVRNNWPLVINDEFDGATLDRGLWNVYDGPSTNERGTFDSDNIEVADGELKLHGHGTSSAGLSWFQGQQYGRWEVRARADAGNGFSPVLLLWPDKEDWPVGGEIDFLELPEGARNQAHFTVHYGEDNAQQANTVAGDFTGWHNYAVEWAPDHVAGFLDGQEIFRTTDPAAIPPRPMHLAIQQDPGPIDGWVPARDASTPADVTMHVDWVRIYGPGSGS